MLSRLVRIGACALVALAAAACGSDGTSGNDGDNGGLACAVGTDACVEDCIRVQCGASIDACADDPICDPALDEMVECVCDAQRASDTNGVRACLTTFRSSGGVLSSAFADCATTMCETACGL